MSSEAHVFHITAVLSVIAWALVTLGAAMGIGHLIVKHLLGRWRCGSGAERLVFCPIVGLALWMLIVAACSHAGSPLVWSAGFGVLSGAWGLIDLVKKSAQRSAWPKRWWLPLVVTLPAWMWVLAPVAMSGGYAPVNDQFTYISISEWLQEHAFSEPVPLDPYRPALTQPWQYQQFGFRMGAIHLLATMQKLSGGATALQVVPAAGLVAVLLFLAGTWLLARWVCRLDRAWSALAVFAAASGCHVLPFSLMSGFLPQVFGFAAATVVLGWWAWMLRRRRLRFGDGAIAGALTAWLGSCYSELLPVVGLGLMVGWLLRLPTLRWSAFPGTTAAAMIAVVIGNIELLRAGRAIMHQMGSKVGWHIDLSVWEFLALAVGHPFDRVMLKHLPRAGDQFMVLFLILTLVIGLWALLRRRRRAWTLVATLCLSVVLFVVFLLQTDPWTGARGHSWSLYKIAQWSCITVIPLQVLGMALVLRRFPRNLGLGIAAILLFAVGGVGWSGQVELARRQADGLQPYSTIGDPVTELAQLPAMVSAQGGDGLQLIRQEPITHPWPDAVYSYALIRHKLASNWHQTTCFGGPSPITAAEGVTPTAKALLVSNGPVFGPGVRPLIAGLFQLPTDAAVMLRPIGPSLAERSGGDWVQWMGREAVTWPLYRPAGAPELTALRFQAEPGPDQPRGRSWTIAWSLGSEQQGHSTHDGAASPLVPLRLAVGMNRLQVWIESALEKHPARPDRRELGLLCRDWSLINNSGWSANAPLGLETTATGKTWRWLGGQQALVIEIFARRAGEGSLSFIPHAGPCNEGSERRLRIEDASGIREVKVSEGVAHRDEVVIPAGTSRVVIKSVDSVMRQAPGGDPRPLVIGIEDLKLTLP